MKRKDYGQSVVMVRVLEKKLLTKNKLDRMIEAETPEEVMKQLSETEYSQNMFDIQQPQEYEKILKRETERVFNLVRELSNDKEIVDILSLKYDYHNLKVLLKGRLANKDFSTLLMDAGTQKIEKLKLKFDIKNYNDLPEEISKAINEVEKDFLENNDSQKIDIIVDKYYYENLLRIAKKINVSVIMDYAQGLIDFQNIITLFRVKKQNRDIKFLENVIVEAINDSVETIINKFRKEKIGSYLLKGLEEFSETGRLSGLEKISQNYLMELNKDSKYIIFGPEPLFTYLVAKEREISAIRMIMVSKINNIEISKIRERLGDTYA